MLQREEGGGIYSRHLFFRHTIFFVCQTPYVLVMERVQEDAVGQVYFFLLIERAGGCSGASQQGKESGTYFAKVSLYSAFT
jgi:hypothetical protein